MNTPEDGWHPVSGNRSFGYTAHDDGTVTFYTRATDRVSTTPYGALSWTLDNILFLGSIFDQGGEVWSGLTQLIADEVGPGAVRDSVIYRPDYDQIHEVLSGDAPVSSLEGCQ